MLFNSAVFLVFFSIVYPVYLCLPFRIQNIFLLAASYIFYGWWDVRFLGLLFISSFVDYLCGSKLHSLTDPGKRKLILLLSLSTNLVILGFFKYYNFFIAGFQSLLGSFGVSLSLPVLNVVLPVGISFYTFQSMSYALDIYRRELKPTKNLWDFLLIVGFFPHLVAGPIQRAANLLSQVTKPRMITQEKVMQGIWLFFLGLFQKAFVADNLAKMVDPVFLKTPSNGAIVLLAVYAYAFQIYGDFAGYSNMARGLAKLMGFELMVNFRNPYFATGPQEFWRRWHISLSTWLRDYLYISLGGNRKGPRRTYVNLFLTMLLGGLWHGAAWHFVCWGGYHGILLAFQRWYEEQLRNRIRTFFPSPVKAPSSFAARFIKILRVCVFFQFIALGWIFFRSQNMIQAAELIDTVMTHFQWGAHAQAYLSRLLFFAGPMMIFELVEYRKDDPCAVQRWHPLLQGAVYFFIYYSLMVYGIQGGEQFVYFQF